MPYNLNTHAVLIEWYMDGVGSYKTISIGKDAFSLYQEIKESIVSNIKNLISQHSEAINESDLSAYYEVFVDSNNDMPEDFNAFEIEKVCINLINEHSNYLNANPLASTIKGKWSHLIDALNDDMKGDYFYITIDGKMPDFARAMIDWLKFNKDDGNVLSLREGQWITSLKTIAENKKWWNIIDTKKLNRFIDDFNKKYEFS